MPTLNNTADRIIRMAMKNVGMLAEGQNPSTENQTDYLARLIDLINLWQTQGIKLWLNRLQTVTLVAGTGDYVFGVQEKRVLEGYYINAQNISTPLIPWAWSDWNRQPNKTAQGTINAYFIDKQLSQTILHLWQVPDGNAALGSCQFLVQDPVTTPPDLTTTVAFPNEWYMALQWGLADEISSGQPQVLVDRAARKAAAYRAALEDWDVEDASTSFAPDIQGRPSKFW